MMILLLRKRGPTARFLGASDTTFLECSLEDLTGKSILLENIREAHIGAVVLEDLHLRDLPCPVARAIADGARGHACPISSRWTNFGTGDVP